MASGSSSHAPRMGPGTPSASGTVGLAPRLMFPSSVSPDGATLVTWSILGSSDLMQITLNDGVVRPLIQTPFVERNGEVSPDGRWLAYESNASGQFQIHVRPFPGIESGQWQVSAKGGTQPAWARGGQSSLPCTGQHAAQRARRTRLDVGGRDTVEAVRPTVPPWHRRERTFGSKLRRVGVS